MTRAAGLIYELASAGEEGRGERLFVGAEMALRICVLPRWVRVPGGPEELLGAAIYEGELVPVVALGGRAVAPRSWIALVCVAAGQAAYVVGGHVAATGLFEREPGDAVGGRGVRFEGAIVPEYELLTTLGRIGDQLRAERWVG